MTSCLVDRDETRNFRAIIWNGRPLKWGITRLPFSLQILRMAINFAQEVNLQAKFYSKNVPFLWRRLTCSRVFNIWPKKYFVPYSYNTVYSKRGPKLVPWATPWMNLHKWAMKLFFKTIAVTFYTESKIICTRSEITNGNKR